MSRLPIRSAALAAAAARLSYAGLRRRPPGGDSTWSRTNHRGEPVTLLEGPAVAIGGVAGALATPGLGWRERSALLVAGAGAAALGSYDDLAGSGSSRGFRGHLGALRRGELTTGAVKLAGIGVTGVAASALLGRSPRAAGRSGNAGTVADLAINAGLVAGGANLLNLFDLRPGRAIKVALGAGALLSAAPRGRGTAGRETAGRGAAGRGVGVRSASLAAAPLAAAAALLPEDLGERAMLGDGGANALGAMLGVAAAASLPRPARVTALAAIVGLTAASEVVSFTKVIERTPALRRLDMLGRRPAPTSAGPAPSAPAQSAPATFGSFPATGGSGTAGDSGASDQAVSEAPASSPVR